MTLQGRNKVPQNDWSVYVRMYVCMYVCTYVRILLCGHARAQYAESEGCYVALLCCGVKLPYVETFHKTH